MAEKRGQYAYLDDGSVAQLVYLTVDESQELNQLPMDMQARLVNTAVTHTGALVSPSGASQQATWQQVPDGMSEFINNLNVDASVSNVYTGVFWSEDGTTITGKSNTTVTSSAFAIKTSNNWLSVGGAFYKVEIFNGDTAPHTCNANIKFRA